MLITMATTTNSPSRPQGAPVLFRYTNWRGEVSDRRAIPVRLWFGATEWHLEPQYLLDAWDMEKEAMRSFAMRDIRGWTQWVSKD